MLYYLVYVTHYTELEDIKSFLSESCGVDAVTVIGICEDLAGVTPTICDYPGGRLIVNVIKVALGMGASLSMGLNLVAGMSAEAEGDAVIICHSFNLCDNALRDSLLKEINNGSDVVIASRYGQPMGYAHFPFLRRLLSLRVNAWMHKTFPIRGVKDYTVLVRAYRLQIIKKAIHFYGPHGLVQSRGYVANTELLIKLSLLSEKISEVYVALDFRRLTSRSRIGWAMTINEYIVLVGYLKRLRDKVLKYTTGEPVHVFKEG